MSVNDKQNAEQRQIIIPEFATERKMAADKTTLTSVAELMIIIASVKVSIGITVLFDRQAYPNNPSTSCRRSFPTENQI
jgi:hypothetical protein